MKLQYLGDSRDSSKWHYHDYLMNNNPGAGTVWLRTHVTTG